MDLPPTKMEKPVEVNFTLQLMDIFDIDPESYTLHMNMVFRYKWIDNRITLEKDIEAVDQNFLEHLWTPHISICMTHVMTLKPHQTIRGHKLKNVALTYA